MPSTTVFYRRIAFGACLVGTLGVVVWQASRMLCTLELPRPTKSIGEAKMAVSNMLDDVKLIATTQKEIVPGMSCELQIELQNGSTLVIGMVGRGGLNQVDVKVFKDGKQCERTKHGNNILRPIGDYEASGPIKTIDSSESLKWNCNLSECFELHPGIYSVVATVTVLAFDGNDIERIGNKDIVSLPLEFAVK